MRRYHMWNSMSYKERSLYNVFDTLTNTAVNNGINKSIIDEAKTLYKKISELKISRGENRNGLIASSIYMACKRNKVPRSAKEIATIFNLKVSTMTRGCKRFQEMLRMNMDATGPADFIARFCSKLNMDSAMKDYCKQVILKAEEFALNYVNTPPSIAAGAILLCSENCNWGITRQMLSDVCDISPVTIYKCANRLSEYRDILMPNGNTYIPSCK
jgi:transcription initiation factor TFIIB